MEFTKNDTTNLNTSSIIEQSIQVIKTLEFFLKIAEKTEQVISKLMGAYEVLGSDIATYENRGQLFFYLENNNKICFDLTNYCFMYVDPDTKKFQRLPHLSDNHSDRENFTKYSSKKIIEIYLACSFLDSFLDEITKKIFESKKGLLGEYHHHVEFAAKCIFEEKL